MEIIYQKHNTRIEKHANGYILIKEVKPTLSPSGDIIPGEFKSASLNFQTQTGGFGWTKDLINFAVTDREEKGLYDDELHDLEITEDNIL